MPAMPVARQALPLLAALTALCACAVPEAKLGDGLVDAGLPRPLAMCMAGRMADRLSLAQLTKIADLPRAREAESLDRFLHRIRALGDPEIVAIASSSGAHCATELTT